MPRPSHRVVASITRQLAGRNRKPFRCGLARPHRRSGIERRMRSPLRRVIDAKQVALDHRATYSRQSLSWSRLHAPDPPHHAVRRGDRRTRCRLQPGSSPRARRRYAACQRGNGQRQRQAGCRRRRLHRRHVQALPHLCRQCRQARVRRQAARLQSGRVEGGCRLAACRARPLRRVRRRPARPERPLPPRLRARGDRRPAILAGGLRLSIQQPGLLHQRPVAQHVPDAPLRTAAATHGGVRRLPGSAASRRRPDQGELQAAAAGVVHRAGREQFRRVRQLLPQRRPGDLRRRQG